MNNRELERVQEALRNALKGSYWPFAVDSGLIEQLAPKIEAALVAVADSVEEVYKDIYHEGSALDEGIKYACVLDGVKKLAG